MISRQHRIMSLAVIATLALSACGKKKDLYSDPAASDASQNASAEVKDKTAAPAPTVTATEKTATPAADNSNKATPTQAAPTDAGNKQLGGTITGGTIAGGIEVKPLPADTDLENLIDGYNSKDPASIDIPNSIKRLTGGVTADRLNYSSSSTDHLLDFLRARNDKADFNNRQANLAAAAAVQSAQFEIEKFSGDAIITLKIKEGNTVNSYVVAGPVAAGAATKLSMVNGGLSTVSTGKTPIDGTLKCVDLDGGCENLFARLRIGTPGSAAIINIVFRNSVADLHFDLPGKHSKNPEYLVLRAMVINTVTDVANTNNKIDKTMISSWEVVNGRSGFSVLMRTLNDQLIGFNGPLLTPDAGSAVNVPVGRVGVEQNGLDLNSIENLKLAYTNSIGEARLVANNSLGQLKLSLKMRQNSQFAQDQFTMTVMRKIKPLVDLNDDNLK